jgi:hypothetical protein
MVHVINSKDMSLALLDAIKIIYYKGISRGGLSKEVIDLVVEIKKPLQIRKSIDRSFRNHIGDVCIKKEQADLP